MKRPKESESTDEQFAAENPSFADLVLNAPIDEDTLPPRRPARVLNEQGEHPPYHQPLPL